MNRLATDRTAPTLHTLLAWLGTRLGATFPASTNGIWRPGDGRAIRRLGIALAGSERVAQSARARAVDAVLLHRPWGLPESDDGLGVIVLHEALDTRLTTGDNPWLARRLGYEIRDGIGDRHGHPLVAIARRATPLTLGTLLVRLRAEFGVDLRQWNPRALDSPIGTIALANAMRPALVACAVNEGAGLYITGTLRPRARALVESGPMSAVGVGHRESEWWGLRWIATEVRARYGIETVPLEGGRQERGRERGGARSPAPPPSTRP